MRHTAAFFALALGGAALDLLTKHLAFAHVPDGGEIPIIEGFFSFGKTRNPGVIFGLGAGARTLWLVVSIAAVPAILAVFYTTKNPRGILTIALGLILAGTIGNMYDRVAEGAVRDFLKFFHTRADGTDAVFPLFNLADSCICVGVFLLSIEMVFFDEKKKKRKDESPKAETPPPPQPAAGTGLEAK
jgi:signal peptidase II